MADDYHSWRIGDPPPPIRPHSLAKHRLIAQYLSQYVEVLTSDPRIPAFALTLVDGFAGGGLYRDSITQQERHGSPLLMLKAMRESEIAAQRKRSKAFALDVEYVFVEKSKETLDYLTATLRQSEFNALVGDKIKLVNDLFINRVDRIVRHIRARGRGGRAIFVLDQFGYAEVPFSAIRSILSRLENAEVILTFATDSLIDYLGQRDSMWRSMEHLGLIRVLHISWASGR